jgi:hypothetical protein
MALIPKRLAPNDECELIQPITSDDASTISFSLSRFFASLDRATIDLLH